MSVVDLIQSAASIATAVGVALAAWQLLISRRQLSVVCHVSSWASPMSRDRPFIRPIVDGIGGLGQQGLLVVDVASADLRWVPLPPRRVHPAHHIEAVVERFHERGKPCARQLPARHCAGSPNDTVP